MADVNISKYRASVVRDGSKPASPGFVVSEGQDPVNPPGTNNFVPYTGATANVELGEFGVEAGFVTLDTTPTNIPTDQGAIYWDDTRSTAALIMNGTLQHIGQDSFFYVKNSSGSTIPKGTCVGFAGTEGGSGHLLITPFLANGSVPSTYFMGVTCESIANGSFGQVMHFGELTGINTSGFTAGALLYASSTVAGAFQTTAPVAPNNIILVAAAVNSKNNGAIVVRPTLGSNFGTNESVKLTSVTDKDLLQYQSGTGVWENKTLAQVIGSAYVPSTRTITINGTALDLSVDRSWSVGDMLLNTYQVVTGTKVFGTNRLIMEGEGTAQPTSLSNTQTSNSALASHNSFGFNGSNNIYFNKGTTANGGIFAFSNTATRTYTLKDASGTLAFVSDIPSLSGYVQGSGTTNYISKFTGSGTIGNSAITDDGTSVNVISRTLTITRGNYSAFGFEIDQQSTFAFGSTNGKRVAIIRDATAADNGLQFGYDTVDKTGIIAGAATSAGTGIDFYTFNGSAWGNRARVTASGNLLVGTTTDNGARLQVSGNVYIARSSNPYLTIDDTGVNSEGGILFKPSGFNSKGGLTINYSTAEQRLFVGEGGNSYFQTFYTNGSERLRITSSGNLGLGVTPNTWTGTGVKAFQFQNGSLAASNTFGALFGWNTYYEGAYKYVSNSTASAFLAAGNDFIWYQAPSGTAGNAISFTQAMTLNASGNLLVGTTSDNGARLQVSGNQTLTGRLLINSTDTTKTPLLLNAEGNFASSGNMTSGFAITNTSFGRALNMGVFESGAYAWIQAAYINNADTTFALALQPRGGNVGIGTTSPGNFNGLSFASPILDVIGSLNVKGIASNGAAVINIGGETFRKAAIYTSIQDQGPYLGFAVATSGTSSSANDVMRLTSGGNVLIGTTTDNGQRFQVNGAGKFNGTVGATSALNVFKTDNSTIGAQFAYDSAINQLYLWNFISSGYFSIYTNSAERFRISSSGFVSAGETTNGRLGVRGFTNDSSGYAFEAANASGNTLFITRNDGASSFFGSVGINVLSPTARLDIRGTGSDGQELLRIESDGNVPDGGYHWMSSAIASSQTTNANIIHLIGVAENTKNSGYFGFHYAGSGSNDNYLKFGGYAADDLMVIKMNGNVLIGTTTDVGARLHVNGDVRTAAPTGGSAVNWRLGTVRGGTITPNATVRVEIGGVLVDLDARYV